MTDGSGRRLNRSGKWWIAHGRDGAILRCHPELAGRNTYDPTQPVRRFATARRAIVALGMMEQ